jgi:methionyl-tRNA synthetase
MRVETYWQAGGLWLFNPDASQELAQLVSFCSPHPFNLQDARGDQCDACGALLNPTELLNPKCKITNTTPVIKQTRHVFLDLPQLSEALQNYIDTTSMRGGWSSNCVTVREALRDL